MNNHYAYHVLVSGHCGCAQDAHLRCLKNHYARFEYKEMETVGVTDYTHQTPS